LEDPTRVARTFQLGKATKETGNEMNIFLTDDAVLLSKTGMIDNIVAPTGDEAGAHFFSLQDILAPIVKIHPEHGSV